jgi:hypothetical protein
VKRLGFVWISVILFSCDSKSHQLEKNISQKVEADSIIDSVTVSKTNTYDDIETTSFDYAIHYLVIADTGSNYYMLHKKMLEISKNYHLKIDTMGRYFNEKKARIVCPDDDEDEIYAGEYFPRRDEEVYLSLEHLDFYLNSSDRKTMALVTAIYENEKSADSLLTILQKTQKKSFKLKSNMYIGCMH